MLWPHSVFFGTDRELLQEIIPFYGRKRRGLWAPRVLDATYGLGTFWSGSTPIIPTVRIDMNPKGPGVIQMDNRQMGFRDETFDAVVYDPPHVSEGENSIYSPHYAHSGTISVSALFSPFLQEAYRTLVPNGCLFTKIADQVHRNHSRWQHVDFINQAELAGFTVCDLIVKVRSNAMMDPKWKTPLHARKYHSFWIISRKGKC